MLTHHRTIPTLLLALLSLLTLTACGDSGGGLSPADVEDLPPGDASGSAASGAYTIELYTTACRGRCAIEVSGFSVSLCDVGELDDADLDVTQTDGHLVMDAQGLVVDRLEGGLDADGAFTVGAWGTEEGGQVEVVVLATGTIDGDAITGAAESRGHGAVDGESFDCTAVYDVTGGRAP